MIKRGSFGLRLSGAFLGTSMLIPIVISLITVALFIVTSTSPSTVGILPLDAKLAATAGGVLLSLLIWAVMAVIYFPYTSARYADAYSYNLLTNRWYRINTWANSIPQPSAKPAEVVTTHDVINYHELMSYCSEARARLYEDGGNWVSTIGYVNVSRLLHRAEEALIMLEPLAAVVADGSRVEVAIENSAIGNKDYYRQTLHRALDYLNPGRLQKYSDLASTKSAIATSELDKNKIDENKAVEARTAIREVTYSLNEFQDDQWEKLVYVRNQLNRMIVLTGLLLYVLLEFAIIAGLSLNTLIAATIFFLIGAGVGIFSRLYEQSRIDSSIGNVRLAGVRLLAALLFSGLAAIGGVVVIQKVAASSASPSFDLSLFNILVSAAFGLTPNLFFHAIQQQVEAIDIKQ